MKEVIQQLHQELPHGIGDQALSLIDNAIQTELAAAATSKVPEGSLTKSDGGSSITSNLLSSLGIYSSEDVSLQTQKKMMRDQDIQIGFYALTAPIIGGGWSVECADGDIALFDQEVLEAIWLPLIQACQDAVCIGFQAFEKVWEIRDITVQVGDDDKKTFPSRAVYKELVDLDPERVEILTAKGELSGLKVDDKITLPIDPTGKTADKGCILTVPRVRWGDYRGFGRLQVAYAPWWSYHAVMRFMLRYLERLGDPPLIGWAPRGSTKNAAGVKRNNLDMIVEAMQNIRSHASVGLPWETDEHGNPLWGIKVLEDDERSEMWLNVLEHLSMLKLRSFLQPEKTIAEGGSTGSFAMVKEQRDLGLQMTMATQRVIFSFVENQILLPMNSANFGPDHPRAKIQPGALDRASLEILNTVMAHIFDWEKGHVPKRPMAELVDRLALAEALRIPLDQDLDQEEEDPGDETSEGSEGQEKPQEKAEDERPPVAGEEEEVEQLGIYLATSFAQSVQKYLKLVRDRAEIWKARTADPILEQELEKMTRAVEKALNQSTPSRQIAAMRKISPTGTAYQKELRSFLEDMHGIGRQAVSEELKLKTVPALTAQDKKYLDAVSQGLAQDRAAQIKRIVNVAGLNAVKWGQSAAEATYQIRDRVVKALRDKSNKTTALSEAWRGYQDGRDAAVKGADLGDDPITHVQWVNSNPTAEICQELSGQIMSASDPRLFALKPPLHHNCRTTMRYIRRSEAEAMGEIPSFKRPSQRAIDKGDEYFIPKELLSTVVKDVDV